MKKILVTFAGGELGVGVTRSLRASDGDLHIVGVDASPFHIQQAEVDERYLVPSSDAPEYIEVLKDIIAETGAEFLWPLHDNEIDVVTHAGDLGVRTFLPTPSTVAICQDKIRSYERFSAAGVAVPETVFIESKQDVRRSLDTLGEAVWLRATRGAGGKGAFRAASYDEAVSWLDTNSGWGFFTAAEILTGKKFKWESVWSDGELIACQSRMGVGQSRLTSMAMGHAVNRSRRDRSVQVTGSTPSVFDTATGAVRAVSERPHGIFSVDLAGDAKGVPKVTEINVGRFTSIGMNYWFPQGFNFPGLVLKLAYGEDPGFVPPAIEPIQAGIYNIQGRNTHPAFTTDAEMESLDQGMNNRIARLANS